MFGQSSYSSFQSFYGTPSFGQQPQVQVGPCAADTTPFPTVSDVFYGGGDGSSVATGTHRLGYPGYDSFQPADADFQPPYFPPPNPAAAQPVGGGAALFAHHRQVPVPVTQQSLQPVVDQSMYWSPINAAAVYTTSANVHAANVDQQKTYHALQQVQVYKHCSCFIHAYFTQSAIECFRWQLAATRVWNALQGRLPSDLRRHFTHFGRFGRNVNAHFFSHYFLVTWFTLRPARWYSVTVTVLTVIVSLLALGSLQIQPRTYNNNNNNNNNNNKGNKK